MKITVTINGEKQNIEAGTSLLSLLRLLDIELGRVAVEYNRDILERNQFDSIFLKDDDSIEIITFVGGGTVLALSEAKTVLALSGAKNG